MIVRMIVSCIGLEEAKEESNPLALHIPAECVSTLLAAYCVIQDFKQEAVLHMMALATIQSQGHHVASVRLECNFPTKMVSFASALKNQTIQWFQFFTRPRHLISINTTRKNDPTHDPLLWT